MRFSPTARAVAPIRFGLSTFQKAALQHRTSSVCGSRKAAVSQQPLGRDRNRKPPTGNILVLSLFLMIAMCGLVAFAVDIGYLCQVRTELQRSADAAALAGAAALYQPGGSLESGYYYLSPDPDAARLESRQFVRLNPTKARTIDVDLNLLNEAEGDVVVGRLHSPSNHLEPLDTTFDPPNTVQVTIPLSASHQNGSVALFFARLLNVPAAETRASAAATVMYPALLPFATSEANWKRLSENGDGDQYAYQPGTGSFGVAQGEDGRPEIRMYPGTWDGVGLPPGNFGLIQVGWDGDTLETVRRQIDMGPSVEDMDRHGGRLAGGDRVEGRTGIKSSAKHAFLGGWADGRQFDGMLGNPRQLPLYESVSGNGENAEYVLSRFVAVRVMALKIDNRWRISEKDSEGEEITGIMVQPLSESAELLHVRLTR